MAKSIDPVGKPLVLAAGLSVNLWIIPPQHSTKELHDLIDLNRASTNWTNESCMKLKRLLNNPPVFFKVYPADLTTGLVPLNPYMAISTIDKLELPSGAIYRTIAS